MRGATNTRPYGTSRAVSSGDGGGGDGGERTSGVAEREWRRKPVRPATTVVIGRLPRYRHADVGCRVSFIGIPALGWHALTLVALKFQRLSVTVPKSLRGRRASGPFAVRRSVPFLGKPNGYESSMHPRSSTVGHRSAISPVNRSDRRWTRQLEWTSKRRCRISSIAADCVSPSCWAPPSRQWVSQNVFVHA